MSKSNNLRRNILLSLAIMITFSFFVIAIITILNLISSNNQKAKESTEPPQPNNSELKLLGDSFSGYSTFRSPAFQKALKDVGLSLRYQDEPTQSKRSELLNRGETDLLVTTLDQFIKQKPQGKIVGLIDRSVGADALVLNTKKYPKLQSFLDLSQLSNEQSQGHQLGIAFARETPSDYLALFWSTKLFNDFDLRKFKVNRVPDALDAWNSIQDQNQDMAIAIIWEPYVTQAQQKGYKVLISSKDTPDAIIDVIVASNKLISSKPEKISELLAAYYQRIDASMIDPSDLIDQIANDAKPQLTPAEAKTILEGIDFFTSIKTKKWFTDGTLEKRISYTRDILTVAGKISQAQIPQNPKELYNSNFVDKAEKNTQKLISSINDPNLIEKLSGEETKNPPPTITNNKVKPEAIGDLKKIEIQFESGSDILTDKSKLTLKKLADDIAEINTQTLAVEVIGHTSKIGTAELNQKLNQKRSRVVVDYLTTLDLKHEFRSKGKGFDEPIAGIPASDPRNQRTVIRVFRIKNTNSNSL